VPQEILDSTRYSDDIDQLERTRAGYVDEEEDAVPDAEITHCFAGKDDRHC